MGSEVDKNRRLDDATWAALGPVMDTGRQWNTDSVKECVEELSFVFFSIESWPEDDELEESEAVLDLVTYYELVSEKMSRVAMAISECFDTEREGWKLPEWSLERAKRVSPRAILGWYRNKLGPFQDLADVWGTVEKPGMNRHDTEHVSVVGANLLKLYEQDGQVDEMEKSAGALAVAFHDSGMAVAGRRYHELNSLSVVQAVFPDWDEDDLFCRRVEYLIRNHTSTHLDPSALRRDKGLALFVLADESHLSDRLTIVGSAPEVYRADPWNRIATHTINSQFEIEGEMLVWEIETDGHEQRDYAQKQVESDYVTDLTRMVLEPKKEILCAASEAIFDGQAQMCVRINKGEMMVFEDLLAIRPEDPRVN